VLVTIVVATPLPMVALTMEPLFVIAEPSRLPPVTDPVLATVRPAPPFSMVPLLLMEPSSVRLPEEAPEESVPALLPPLKVVAAAPPAVRFPLFVTPENFTRWPLCELVPIVPFREPLLMVAAAEPVPMVRVAVPCCLIAPDELSTVPLSVRLQLPQAAPVCRVPLLLPLLNVVPAVPPVVSVPLLAAPLKDTKTLPERS